MRVGIYQDLRDPPKWQRGWSAVAGTALERIEEAERLGFGAVWSSEHHFFEDSYLSQPLTWGAAVAARTSTIRIGTGIVIAPLHKPLEIAEQAAVVDQISGGRVELGLGVGYVGREFEAFGVDRGRRFELTEECIKEIRRLYAEGIVTPGPFDEEIPIWFGGFGPRGARLAGRNGCGLLWLDDNLLPPYREGLAAGGHDTNEARMGGLATMIVSDDPERAWAQLEPHLQYQWQSYEHAATAGVEDAGMAMLDEGAKIERVAGPAMLPPGYDTVTPDEAVRRVHAWLGRLPVTDVFFWESVAGMPDDLVAEHMDLLGREVMPRITSIGE